VTPTGGGKTHSRPDYGTHGRRLLAKAISTSEILHTKADFDLIEEVVYSVITADDAKLKDRRHSLKKIGIEVVQLDPSDNKKGIAISNREDFNKIIEKISLYADSKSNTGKSYFSAIETIEEVDPISKIDRNLIANGIYDCIIYLYPMLSPEEQNKVVQTISFSINTSQAIESDTRFFTTSSSGYALSATLSNQEILRIASEFTSIRLIKPNSSLQLNPAISGPSIPGGLTTISPASEVKVGVIDSGIMGSSHLLTPLIAETYHDLGIGVTFDTSHGTLVASRIAYGDSMADQLSNGLLEPACLLVDIPIFYKDHSGRNCTLRESDVIELLNNFIPTHRDVKIFNLSFGNYSPISDYSISPLAHELDSLSKKYDVLFVVAAGNIPHNSPYDWSTFPAYKGSANSRINAPAESLLSVSVGSYATHQETVDIANPMSLSPFSRNGPGLDLGIKPELTAPGGNCRVTAGKGNFHYNSAALGLDASGKKLAYNIGTSFAAPVVCHYAAKILSDNSGISTNMLKCLLFHYTSNIGLSGATPMRPDNYYGFGEFQMSDYNGDQLNRLVYLHEGIIESENYIHIPFHIPSSVDPQKSPKIKIKLTITHDPDVDEVNPMEYSLSDILFQLSKVENGSKIAVAGSNASTSKYSQKWNPTVRYERTFSRNFSSGEWELRLRLNTRGNLPDSYTQNFAVVIECIDETEQLNLFDDVMRQYGAKYDVLIRKSGDAI